MGLFKSIFKAIKKVLKAPVDLIKKAFKGDPLAILGTLGAMYGGYTLLADSGLTGAGVAAAEGATQTAPTAAAGMAGASSVSSDLAAIGSEIAGASEAATTGGLVGSGMSAASEAGNFYPTISELSPMSTGQLANVTNTATQTTTSKGLLGGIKDWWGKLEPKDKLMAGAMGVKAIGNFMQGIQEADFNKKYLKLKEMQTKGIGSWNKSYKDMYKNLKDFQKESKKYEGKVKMWYETDSAFMKKINYVQQRLEDPEYRRGFYTMAGLLANPKGGALLKSDPSSMIYG